MKLQGDHIHLNPTQQIIVVTRVVLRAVLFLLFLHALGTKTGLVQQSFQQVLHGWVPRCIIAVNISKQRDKHLSKLLLKTHLVKSMTRVPTRVDQTNSRLKKTIDVLVNVREEAYLKNVNCSPYIQGCSCREGYFPNGGTMRLKSRATSTNTAGRTT